jgi:hypothetical protein
MGIDCSVDEGTPSENDALHAGSNSNSSSNKNTTSGESSLSNVSNIGFVFGENCGKAFSFKPKVGVFGSGFEFESWSNDDVNLDLETLQI